MLTRTHVNVLWIRSKTYTQSEELLRTRVPFDSQCRFVASKKKSQQKRPKSNEPSKYNNNKFSMSESERPNSNHVSSGGQFQIETSDCSKQSSNQWTSERETYKKHEKMNADHNIPSDFRVWEAVSNDQSRSSGGATSIQFKVLSYNVLAQVLLEGYPYLYRECSPHCLVWKFRANLLYEEVTKLAPDIICFQEVQASHISSFFSKFETMGYFGIFKQKTGRRRDGCAIYFKKSMFEMKEHISVEYFQPDLPILNKDNIGLMVKLVPKALPDQPFVVATTHLLYAPPRTDVRLAQVQVLLAEIDRFSFVQNDKGNTHLPIILTGDFNSMPNSAVIQLLDTGSVCAAPFRDGLDWSKVGITDNCQHLAVHLGRKNGDSTLISPKQLQIYHTDYNTAESDNSTDSKNSGLFNGVELRHSLNLSPVYDYRKRDGQFEATTFQDYWITVDYMYFSQYSNLTLQHRLRLPTAAECEVLRCLPNEVYGSDHLALAAIFQLTAHSNFMKRNRL